MKRNKLFKLFLSIIICELAGAIGSVFTTPQINGWYKSLNKPSFNPPSWIFGPVWTIIFILMGVSLYLVWLNKWEPKNKLNFSKQKAWNKISQKFYNGKWQKLNIILIFSFQLLLNIVWSVIFFQTHALGAAFFELIMLWFAILYTIVNFYRVSRATFWLLLPYILWVTFAGFLNFYIWILN